jgi:hypothetical protein
MSGRCPNCGKPIEPPQPASPSAPLLYASEEPLGLVPIEEEWPEPAQLEGVDDRLQYDFGSQPSQWSEPERQKPPELEGYGLEGGPPVRSPPTPSTAESLPESYSVSLQAPESEARQISPETLDESYPVHLPHAGPSSARSPRGIPSDAYQATLPKISPPSFPVATPVIEEKKGPEKIPPPPPLPPSRPLVEGVYTFPWHLGSLKVWIIAGLQLAIMGLLTCFWIRLGMFAGFGPVLLPALGVIGLLTGAYAAANFAAVVEDSAWGNDSFSAGEYFGERVGYLLHLIYIGFCSLIPTFLIGGAAPAILAYLSFNPKWGTLALVINLAGLVALVPFFLIFPIFYLSSLAAKSRLAILDLRVVGGFLRNPRSSFVLFFVSLILGSICYELGWLLLVLLFLRFAWGALFALATGLIWSACLLIYARLLGRVAWVISQGGIKVKRRKKRRKKPTPGPDDWGTGMQSEEGEKPVPDIPGGSFGAAE